MNLIKKETKSSKKLSIFKYVISSSNRKKPKKNSKIISEEKLQKEKKETEEMLTKLKEIMTAQTAEKGMDQKVP